MADTQSNIQVNIDTAQALASIKNLQRQISAFHSSMAKGGAAANAVSTQLQQTLINSINATGQFSAGIRTIRTTTESFTNSLEKNKFSLGEYFRYAGGATKTFGRLFKTEHDTINKVARENVKDLQTQYIRLGRDASGAMRSIAVRPLALDMTDLGTRTQIAAQKQAILNQLLKQGSTNLLNFGKNTQWAGRQLMVGFTLPLIAVGSAASKTFMDMETQAIRFKKVYGDLFTPTGESQQALKDIQELGKEFTKYGIAVSTTVGLAAEAAAAGFKGVDLQRQTAAATRLSILGQVESQKALETTIALQNAFSMSSENLSESIDFLNAVENQTVLSLDDISTAIPKAAPVVQQLGGDVKDLAFLMTAMKEGGINASEGANALKSGLASLINPTGKANDMLLSFGINAKKIVLDNKGDLKKTVVEFATALNMLDPLNRAQAIEQMFGKFQFARLSTLFANVTKEGTQASRVLDLAGASVQELAGLAEKELGMTSESAMNKFKGAVENLKLSLIPLGEQFLKAVTPIAEFITKVLDKFNGFSDNTKKIIVVLTGIVAGLGPVLLMTVGLVMNGLANMIKLFSFLKSSFNKTGQATAILGTEVQYMTTEQRNAAAVAASLDQVHTKLAQTFTSETTAVNALTRAYQRAIAAQSQFVPVAPPITRGPIKKFADGRPLTVGGTGNQDSELALLMPGETVIPTKMSKKYGPLINAMIAGNIPGYEFGKEDGTPGAFSFGGREFPVRQASIPSVRRFIAQIQQLGGVVSNIDDVIFKVLEDMTSELEKGAKITKSGLEKAMAASNVTELAKSTKAAQGGFEGNAGAVMAHGLPKITLTPEQVKAFEGTTVGTRLADRVPGAPVTGLSNMVFPMPAAFNQDRMTGAEGAQWIGQNRTRFTTDFAAQAGLNPNDPDLLRFGTAVGKALKSAAYRGVVVTQEDFERIISQALEKEIFDVGKNTSTAVKTAFADAKKVSTLMFPTVSQSGRTGYSRVPVAEDMRGTTVDGIPLAQGSSYKNRGVTGAQHEAADKFTMKAVRARVRRFFTKMPKEVEQEVKEVLDINSPSRATKKLGNDTATGFVSGVKELNDEARAAGKQVGSSVVSGATQSGRARRVATRPQGPAPIGATPQPGMRILPIVPPNPKGPIPPDPNGPTPTTQTRGQMLADRARGVGTRMNSMGGGMGLLGVNMGLSMLPDFAGKGVIQGGLAGANLGMMFGPYGMAAGAAIGLVTSALGNLIEKQKQHKAMTEAMFKSSSSVAEFFGNAVVNTTMEVGRLSSATLAASSSTENLGKNFGYTNEELQRFSDLVNSLPQGNPLKDILVGLEDVTDPEEIKKIIDNFVTTQVAVGQTLPEQAQKIYDLILAQSGNQSMVGQSFYNFKTQSEAVSATLKNARKNSVDLGNSLIQLTGAASNSSSLIFIKSIIDGIAASGISAAEGLNAMYYAYIRIGNQGAADSLQNLRRIQGLTQAEINSLMISGTQGFSYPVGQDTTRKEILEAQAEFNKTLKEEGLVKSGIKPYKNLADEKTISIKKEIDLLKKRKKIIDDQIKKEKQITDELKKQNDYRDKQLKIDKDIVEAKIRGDYIGAAILLQEKTSLTDEFNKENQLSALQARSDALQQQIEERQSVSDDMVAAIQSTTDAVTTGSANIVTAVREAGGFPSIDGDGSFKSPLTIASDAASIKSYIESDKPSAGVSNEGVSVGTVAPSAIDAAKAYNETFAEKITRLTQPGLKTEMQMLEDYIRTQIVFPPDKKHIFIEIKGSDGLFYKFKVAKDKNAKNGFIRVGDPIKKAAGGYIENFMGGGNVRGAGTETSDSIAAYLSNGEYVIKAKSVKKYGTETFDALNAGRFANGGLIKGYDNGGLVSGTGMYSGRMFIPPKYSTSYSEQYDPRTKQPFKFPAEGETVHFMEDMLPPSMRPQKSLFGQFKRLFTPSLWGIGKDVRGKDVTGGVVDLPYNVGYKGIYKNLLFPTALMLDRATRLGPSGPSGLYGSPLAGTNKKREAELLARSRAEGFGSVAPEVLLTAGLDMASVFPLTGVGSKIGNIGFSQAQIAKMAAEKAAQKAATRSALEKAGIGLPGMMQSIQSRLSPQAALRKKTAFAKNAAVAAMIGASKPFAENKLSLMLPELKSKNSVSTSITAKPGTKKHAGTLSDWVEHDGYRIPVYRGGPFGENESVIFQGMGEDFSPILKRGHVTTVIPTSPSGILKYALDQKPGDKNLQELLNSFTADPTIPGVIGKKEEEFLMQMLASLNINLVKNTTFGSKRTFFPKLADSQSTEGLMTFISSLLGNEKASSIVKSKTKAMNPELKKIVDSYVKEAEEQRSAMAARAAQGYDVAPTITLDEVPMIRSYNHGITYNKDGDIVEQAAGFHIFKDIFGPSGGTQGGIARSTKHFTIGDSVQQRTGHTSGSVWSPNQPKVVTTLRNLIDNNGNPENLHEVDSWWIQQFGKEFKIGRKNASVIQPITGRKDYIEELKKLGIYKEGEEFPIIAENATNKSVHYLQKPKYSEKEIEQILKEFSDNRYELPSISRIPQSKMNGNLKRKGFLFQDSHGIAYTAHRLLEILAIQRAKKQIGIDTPFQRLQDHSSSSITLSDDIAAIARTIGAKPSSRHSDSSLSDLESAGTKGFFDQGTEENPDFINPFKLLQRGGTSSTENALSAMLMHQFFGKYSSGKVRSNSTDPAIRLSEATGLYVRQLMEYRSGATTTPPSWEEYVALTKKIQKDLEDSRLALSAGGYINNRKVKLPKFANGGSIKGYAMGGLIKGPGTGISDSIQAGFGYAGGGSIRVSNGEYIVKASSVRDYGVKTMDAINNGTARVGTESGGTVYNINMPVTSNNANPEIVANEVMRKLKLEISKNNKTNRVGG